MKKEKRDRKFIAPYVILFFLFSCATAPVQQSIESTQPQWQFFSDGIDYLHAKISSPKIEFHALRIDLTSPNVRIVIDEGADTVSGFVKKNNLIAGINATPFDERKKNVGLVISNGKQLSPVNNNYDALVFYKEGQLEGTAGTRAVIANQSSIYTTVNIDNAIGGFHQILADGQPAQRTAREGTVSAQRHPRSAAGISSNNRILYLLVIDGRRPGSIGATERETALLLRALGSNNGINFDGGGSTALVLRFPDGKVKPVNKPSDPFGERKVAACLGISLSKEK